MIPHIPMRSTKSYLLCVACLFVTAACSPVGGQTRATGATLFEGARLITGDGSASIENSAFVVENNRFSRIGMKGQVQAPPGAARVDLTGKTVMPAIVNAHNHLGWAIIKTGEIGKDTYS